MQYVIRYNPHCGGKCGMYSVSESLEQLLAAPAVTLASPRVRGFSSPEEAELVIAAMGLDVVSKRLVPPFWSAGQFYDDVQEWVLL